MFILKFGTRYLIFVTTRSEKIACCYNAAKAKVIQVKNGVHDHLFGICISYFNFSVI